MCDEIEDAVPWYVREIEGGRHRILVERLAFPVAIRRTLLRCWVEGQREGRRECFLDCPVQITEQHRYFVVLENTETTRELGVVVMLQRAKRPRQAQLCLVAQGDIAVLLKDSNRLVDIGR